MPDSQTSNPRTDTTRPETPVTNIGVAGEMNVETYPLFLMSQASAKRITEYGVQSRIQHSRAEETDFLNQSWVVSANGSLGPPRGVDQDVYMAVIEMLYRYGGLPENNTLFFTCYEMCMILGWSDTGEMYRRLRESLERISSATIQAKDSFWSDTRQAFVSKTFRLWSVAFGFYRGPSLGLEERHRIVFDPLFAENWRSTYQPNLDTSFYWKLESHVSKRLYRLLDCCAAAPADTKARTFQVDLTRLQGLMPLVGYQYASQILRVLAPAYEELRSKGFLSEVKIYKPEGKYGPALVHFVVSAKFDRRRVAEAPETDLYKAAAIQQMLAVTTNLQTRLSRKVARDLVEEYGPDRCLYYAELLPEHNPTHAGLLVNAIKNAYPWERQEKSGNTEVAAGTGNRTSSSLPGSGTSAAGAASAQPSTPGNTGGSGKKPPSGEFKEGYEWFFGESGSEHSPGPESKQLADEVYQAILKDLSNGGTSSVGVWFEGTYARSLEAGVLTLVVPNSAARDYITRRFKAPLEDSLRDILATRNLPPECRLELVVASYTPHIQDLPSTTQGGG